MNSHYRFFFFVFYTLCVKLGRWILIVEVKIGRCSGCAEGGQEDRSRRFCPRASSVPHCSLGNTQLLPPAVVVDCERPL